MHYTDVKRASGESEKYIYAWDHYTGEYALDTKIRSYLHRKEQREAERAYQERLDLSDPVLHFPTAVDSLNGIVSAKDADTQREWGDLGDVKEPDSIAYKLNKNADGEGTNWRPLMKQAGIRLTVMHKVWGLADGIVKEGETVKEASVKIINPQQIEDYFPRQGNLRQVLVKEKRDLRTGIQDTEGEEDAETYILYELGGWTRFKVEEYKDEQGELQKREVILDSKEYEFWSDKDRSMRILPIFFTEIPMPRHVGYLLAKKQNHIFNQESRRDFSLGNMSFAMGILKATQDHYDDFISKIEKGYNWTREDPEISGDGHRYMSPDSSFLSEFREVLERKTKDFYESAFKQYGDAAKQVTATEIRLESRTGIEAFLSLLVTSIDEFENDSLWRLMQIYHRDNPSAWGSASVKRSRDFQPKDVAEAMEKMSSTVLNADRAKAISTKRKVELLNPEMTEDEIEEEVKRILNEGGAIDVPDNQAGG